MEDLLLIQPFCILLNTVQNSKHWQSVWSLINMLEALIYYKTLQESHTGGIVESKKKRKEYAKILLNLNVINVA